MAAEPLLDSKETAALLGCTESALALWRKQHRGPSYIRVGQRLVRYRQQDVVNWLEVQRVDSCERAGSRGASTCLGRAEGTPSAKITTASRSHR